MSYRNLCCHFRRFQNSSPYFVADSTDPDLPNNAAGNNATAAAATAATLKGANGHQHQQQHSVKLTTSFSTLEKKIGDNTLKSKVIG